MDAARVAVTVAAALAAAALVVIAVAVGGDSWPLLLGWLVGIAVVAGVAYALRARPGLRLGAAAFLPVACVVLTWEGGLFFVPAAIALLVAAIVSRRRAIA